MTVSRLALRCEFAGEFRLYADPRCRRINVLSFSSLRRSPLAALTADTQHVRFLGWPRDGWTRLRECLLMALSGHSAGQCPCPLLTQSGHSQPENESSALRGLFNSPDELRRDLALPRAVGVWPRVTFSSQIPHCWLRLEPTEAPRVRTASDAFDPRGAGVFLMVPLNSATRPWAPEKEAPRKFKCRYVGGSPCNTSSATRMLQRPSVRSNLVLSATARQ